MFRFLASLDNLEIRQHRAHPASGQELAGPEWPCSVMSGFTVLSTIHPASLGLLPLSHWLESKLPGSTGEIVQVWAINAALLKVG